MTTVQLVIVSIIGFIVFLFILYFVIRWAIQDALKNPIDNIRKQTRIMAHKMRKEGATDDDMKDVLR